MTADSSMLAIMMRSAPPQRAHLTHYHGVFAPHAPLRAATTLARRGPGVHS